ncbi:XTP/dITP diphosphatase [Paenibacillus lemnae]|uniref:dITP/XTP pyrophosphatase n=1 Tax=Paenibacillus lemnae TaxID=1330551 RepID=A0A848M6Q2_PAELE|nr:XTP/dITP diphosphatase [Paenibacillus lemnae]NMO95274.1 XTP/dITP diphosphatase [Paenibacillus lemnae]
MKLTGETLIVATRNPGKVKEFSHAFAPFGWSVKSMFDYPELPDVVEDGNTFSDNAYKKAKTIGDALGMPVLADDSGLCVDALGGDPGVYSARYAGEHGDDVANNDKLLTELSRLRTSDASNENERMLSPAQFVCVLVLYDPLSGEHVETRGTADGWITSEPQGDGGFGYDPLFYLKQYGKTMAQLTLDEKQAVSHRGHALRQLTEKLSAFQ